jgi:hypothetical protein
MSKKETHTQCSLENGNKRYTCWLPTDKAIIGKVLKIEEEDGWKVTGTGMTLPSSYVNERSRDYRTQRQGSDI